MSRLLDYILANWERVALGAVLGLVFALIITWIAVRAYVVRSLSDAAASLKDDLPDDPLPPINQPLPQGSSEIASPRVVKFASASRRDGKGVKVAK